MRARPESTITHRNQRKNNLIVLDLLDVQKIIQILFTDTSRRSGRNFVVNRTLLGFSLYSLHSSVSIKRTAFLIER